MTTDGTDTRAAGHPLIHEAVTEQARLRPDATAVVFRDELISYCVLDAAADHYAAQLAARGAGPGTIVPVRLPRSPRMIAALLASGLGGLNGPTEPAAIPQSCPAVHGTPAAPVLSQARRDLVPFAPTGALLCLYAMTSSVVNPGSPSALTGQARIDGAAAARLADDLDAAARASSRLLGCGVDLGDIVDAYVQGDGQSIEVLITGLPGCSGATNGPKGGSIADGEVVPELQGLLGLDSWPGIPG